MSRLIRATVVTFAEAEAIIDEDGHGETDGNPDGLARVYVSPEVDRWTLVIGWWCDPCDGERSDEVLRLCTELSARYGRAQAYYYGAQGDGSAWLIAEGGAVLRRYCATGQAEDTLFTLGEPLPLEKGPTGAVGAVAGLRPGGRRRRGRERMEIGRVPSRSRDGSCPGRQPLTLTAQTRVRGTGVLALTPHPASAEAGPVT
ncbi:hypothetical protein ABZ468_54530 [Streptomyces sp. NPDC005708]|uniref:hypothetical protein n=1 Tax=Streptomyces sp. NPDC005708 TaxID=3154564 RepID=UPI0033E65D28